MGAGFGHVYTLYNKSYAALAFSPENGDLFELAEEYVRAQNAEIEDQDAYYTVEHEAEHLADCLSEDLEAIKTVEVTFKGHLFDVYIDLEPTYYGDDMCLVPRNLWESYADAVEDSSTQPDKINWQAVATHEDDLVKAFERALCNVVFKKYPYMYARRRSLGWCGTGYKPVAQLLSELAF